MFIRKKVKLLEEKVNALEIKLCEKEKYIKELIQTQGTSIKNNIDSIIFRIAALEEYKTKTEINKVDETVDKAVDNYISFINDIIDDLEEVQKEECRKTKSKSKNKKTSNKKESK